MHGNDVHVTFAQNQVVSFGAPRQIQGVQIPALIKNLCVRRIDIFGLCIPQDASSEADHPAADILDGEHDAVEKAIVESLFFIEDCDIRFQDEFIGKALFP